MNSLVHWARLDYFQESKEASHGTLAKIISTNVSVQFLRRLGNRRVGVARGARVHRSARVRVESGLAGRAGTSLGYPSAISLFLPINMAHLHAGAARMRGAIIERNRLPGTESNGRLRTQSQQISVD